MGHVVQVSCEEAAIVSREMERGGDPWIPPGSLHALMNLILLLKSEGATSREAISRAMLKSFRGRQRSGTPPKKVYERACRRFLRKIEQGSKAYQEASGSLPPSGRKQKRRKRPSRQQGSFRF